MNTKGKIIWISGLIASILVVVGIFTVDPVNRYREWRASSDQAAVLASFEDDVIEDESLLESGTGGATDPVEEAEIVIKDKVNLDVQFIAQAPLGTGEAHWDVHAESCEEAASIMAHNFIVGRTVTPQQAEQDIFDLIDWQIANFGAEYDIYPDRIKEMVEGFWGHDDVIVIENATIEDIKAQLSQGYPIIVPTIAAHLKNPRYYDQDYHMLVAKGYNETHIITHDNGTTWGEDYVYPYADFHKALSAAGGSIAVIRK